MYRVVSSHSLNFIREEKDCARIISSGMHEPLRAPQKRSALNKSRSRIMPVLCIKQHVTRQKRICFFNRRFRPTCWRYRLYCGGFRVAGYEAASIRPDSQTGRSKQVPTQAHPLCNPCDDMPSQLELKCTYHVVLVSAIKKHGRLIGRGGG